MSILVSVSCWFAIQALLYYIFLFFFRNWWLRTALWIDSHWISPLRERKASANNIWDAVYYQSATWLAVCERRGQCVKKLRRGKNISVVEGGLCCLCTQPPIKMTDEVWHTLPAACYQSLGRVRQIMCAVTPCSDELPLSSSYLPFAPPHSLLLSPSVALKWPSPLTLALLYL